MCFEKQWVLNVERNVAINLVQFIFTVKYVSGGVMQAGRI